jgi:hypothetical protein
MENYSVITHRLSIYTHPLTHIFTYHNASDDDFSNTSDKEPPPPPNKRPRKSPVDTDDKGKCPVCGTRVADKHSYHKHRGTYYHEACYLEDVRRTRLQGPSTYAPPDHPEDPKDRACPVTGCPTKVHTDSQLLAHFKRAHKNIAEYPQLCEDIPRARRCPICHSYQYGPLGLAQHMSYGCYEQL